MDLDFEKDIVEIETRIAELSKPPEPPPPAPEGQTAAEAKAEAKEAKAEAKEAKAEASAEIAELKKKLDTLKKDVYAGLTPWQTVQVARILLLRRIAVRLECQVELVQIALAASTLG